jgi:hypothetical protein
MSVRLILISLVMLLMLVSRDASATPVTWNATGHLNTVGDTFGVLNPLAPGAQWMLSFTFDSDASATALSCGAPTYRYAGAIKATTFQVGGFAYSNAGGDIYTNYALPVGTCGSPLDSLGLVQFQWLQGWVGSPGAPDLNHNLGLLLASYRDMNSMTGALPFAPHMHPTQSPFSGLEWDGVLGGGPIYEQFTSDFNPVSAPVPEPGTIVLVSIGAASIARRLRASRQS